MRRIINQANITQKQKKNDLRRYCRIQSVGTEVVSQDTYSWKHYFKSDDKLYLCVLFLREKQLDVRICWCVSRWSNLSVERLDQGRTAVFVVAERVSRTALWLDFIGQWSCVRAQFLQANNTLRMVDAFLGHATRRGRRVRVRNRLYIYSSTYSMRTAGYKTSTFEKVYSTQWWCIVYVLCTTVAVLIVPQVARLKLLATRVPK